MIDTGINPGHDTFAGADLDVVRLAPADLAPSRAQHGTAVASILVGSADSRTPGLVPGARLIAVDAFHRDGSDERSDAFSLISGLGLLAERGATVINLSLAGPPNEPVRETIAALRARGIAIVAAAGNGGPKSAPAFPAAYDGVIAVTAVDRNGNVYRRAAQGPYVDIAAPGVEVWAAASVRGARPKTGTSFAAPFVTAAAYVLLAADVPADQVEAQLAASATDLGEAGRDEVFGNGLLNLADLCGMSGG
jgi:subtilisin family serine protease